MISFPIDESDESIIEEHDANNTEQPSIVKTSESCCNCVST